MTPPAEVSHKKTVNNVGIFIWRNFSVVWSHCCFDWLLHATLPSVYHMENLIVGVLIVYPENGCVIGPKDLPIISRTAGRLAGRAIGYVQLARGQFETVMQQSQARQVLPSSPIRVTTHKD